MEIELRELSVDDGMDIFDMIREIGPGENGFTSNFPLDRFEAFKSKLPELVDNARGINLPEGYVPQTIYWLYIDGKPVAYGKLRHALNEQLLRHGGHIGYTVRPSERGKGYGKLLLKELLRAAKKKHLDKVLITCNVDNVRSRRVVESNGGMLENIIDRTCRYWIHLNEGVDSLTVS